LHGKETAGPRTLFATHYHELTQLASSLNRLRNWSVAVKEWQDEIVFIRRVVPGAADRSYGIQVARLAGMPPGVVSRAREILSGLETGGGLPNKQVVKTADVSELVVPTKVAKKETKPSAPKASPEKKNQDPELDLFG
jgi:DNA mismatch repair protein MutS